ncbi:putative quinol monooxygenase [Frateuria aurantia]
MSTDFHLIASFKVKPGSEAIALDALKLCAPLSRNEAGCLSYVPYQDIEDATRFHFIEHWTSPAALDGHMQTPHFKAMMNALEPVLSEPLAIVSKQQPVI